MLRLFRRPRDDCWGKRHVRIKLIFLGMKHFCLDSRNAGGRKAVESLMVSHYKSLYSIKPMVDTRTPQLGLTKTHSADHIFQGEPNRLRGGFPILGRSTKLQLPLSKFLIETPLHRDLVKKTRSWRVTILNAN